MYGEFPRVRMRRNRAFSWQRDLVAENRLASSDFVLPVFVRREPGRQAIQELDGAFVWGLDCLGEVVDEAKAAGLPAIALFPRVPDCLRSADCAEAFRPDNLICEAVRACKRFQPELGVICDVALDPYNDCGHDGLLRDGEVRNDPTLHVLAQQARVLAAAGCDVVAPSDMMDGRVGRIRSALDSGGFEHVGILSYAAKYASSLYGPFRCVIGSSLSLKGDKRSYQMNPANGNEAMREVALDLREGADSILIKPGLPYLDVLYRVKKRFQVPTFVYHVSGEYAMLCAAATRGLLDWRSAFLELMLCCKRAGADGVFTYGALAAAKFLREG